MPKKVVEKVIDETEKHLKMLKELGVDQLSREKTDPVYARKLRALNQLRRELGDCQRCPLSKTRTKIVFGEGDPCARIVFVGEAPGEKEDESGKPFVGSAGRILTDIIERGMKIPRSSVYICNVIKCRPPKNRDPRPEEIQACRPFLEKQLKIIQPEVIIALGKYASQWLLNTQLPISQLRGRWGEYQGIPVMPTYHPAYLLHNQKGKREVWQDIKKVINYLKQRSSK